MNELKVQPAKKRIRGLGIVDLCRFYCGLRDTNDYERGSALQGMKHRDKMTLVNDELDSREKTWWGKIKTEIARYRYGASITPPPFDLRVNLAITASEQPS